MGKMVMRLEGFISLPGEEDVLNGYAVMHPDRKYIDIEVKPGVEVMLRLDDITAMLEHLADMQVGTGVDMTSAAQAQPKRDEAHESLKFLVGKIEFLERWLEAAGAIKDNGRRNSMQEWMEHVDVIAAALRKTQADKRLPIPKELRATISGCIDAAVSSTYRLAKEGILTLEEASYRRKHYEKTDRWFEENTRLEDADA